MQPPYPIHHTQPRRGQLETRAVHARFPPLDVREAAVARRSEVAVTVDVHDDGGLIAVRAERGEPSAERRGVVVHYHHAQIGGGGAVALAVRETDRAEQQHGQTVPTGRQQKLHLPKLN